MFSRTRLTRLAEKYGFNFRFFPGGNEDPDAEPKDDDTPADDVIKDADSKIEKSAEFKGLLRDKIETAKALSQTNAELAMARQKLADLQAKMERSQKPNEPELTEEQAAEEISRGELHRELKAREQRLLEQISKVLDDRDKKNQANTLKRQQASDAKALITEATEKTKGKTLDANTVVNEAIAELKRSDPELLDFLSKKPNFASLIYKMATGEPLVESVGKRVKLRRNALIAKNLDQGGDDLPGGGGPSRDELMTLETIISEGENMTDEQIFELTG